MRYYLKKRHALVKAMVGLFAVQMVLTGICMLSPNAHAAMPITNMTSTTMSNTTSTTTSNMMAQQGDTMAGHCSQTLSHAPHQANDAHSKACFHCDDSDMFVKAAVADVPVFSPVLVFVSVMPEVSVWHAEQAVSMAVMPTGPPRSDSLLFSTTRRIRI